MKSILTTCILLLLIVEILLFPQEAMLYASKGLTLWFDNMIPALFPFMVLSGLIIRLELAPYIVSLFHPLMHKIFRTNHYCEYAILMGFLCGYPMGALIIHDLLKEEKITLEQGNYLLSFCNNIGPVFFVSIVLPIFEKDLHIMLLSGMYLIPLLYGVIIRYTLCKNAFKQCGNQVHPVIKVENEDTQFASALTNSFNRAVSASLYLGACMIFFNMLRFIPAKIFGTSDILPVLSSWILEVNGAITLTGELYSSGNVNESILLLPMLAIGGISCICQTSGVLNDTGCNIKHHFIHKCIQAFLWLILMLLWLPMIK